MIEEAEGGKLYVRGHDRQGRPIIHYSPGLEISFDTERVRQAAGSCCVSGGRGGAGRARVVEYLA